MKNILIAYDRMMMGGTTTALLSMLDMFDYSAFSIDLILYENGGPFIKDIPLNVNLLAPAYKKSPIVDLGSSKRKIIRSVFNGGIIKSFLAYTKYKGTEKGNMRNILAHYSVEAQVSISRSISKEYDIAIGFIEGWADHYILSDKVKAKKKLVWTHPDYQSSYLIPEVDRSVFKYADYLVTVSNQCAESMKKVFPEFQNKIIVIENFTSSRRIIERANEVDATIRKGGLNICTVARCDIDVKGLDRIVTVLTRLKNENLLNRLLWHYIGAGKDFDELKRMIDDNGIQENVVLYGELKNPLPYLKNMDVFLLASRYEGKPVSVTEAQVLGVPCIVTNYASAKEQVRDGVDGIITQNDVESIFDAIKRWILNPELRTSLKHNIAEKEYGNEDNIRTFNCVLK
jgi:glycosyltransferase involved in cell wall biosynthesis